MSATVQPFTSVYTHAPIDGKLGPAEYTDAFLVNAYRTYIWTSHAQVLAVWVLRGDAEGLRWEIVEPDYPAHNTHAMFNATQCLDGAWPRDWDRWGSSYIQAAFTYTRRGGNRFNAQSDVPADTSDFDSASPAGVGSSSAADDDIPF